jgi:hypothetical protein
MGSSAHAEARKYSAQNGAGDLDVATTISLNDIKNWVNFRATPIDE